jgi:hypothetical protein
VIVVWEKLSDAERTVSKEGGALSTVYRLSGGLDDEPRQSLRQALSEYAKIVIREDWPAMEHGTFSAQATGALDHLYSNVLPMRPSDQHGAVIMREILQQLDVITQARRDRLVSARGTVPDVLWAVLLCGGFMTIGFTFFFGTQNVIAQGLMTGALSFLIFSSLLLIVAIDQPFAGPVQVQPDALFAAQQEFAKQQVLDHIPRFLHGCSKCTLTAALANRDTAAIKEVLLALVDCPKQAEGIGLSAGNAMTFFGGCCAGIALGRARCLTMGAKHLGCLRGLPMQKARLLS